MATKNIQFTMDERQAAALREHCAALGMGVSGFVRDTIMRRIGRKDLAGIVPRRGRPRKWKRYQPVPD